MFGRKTPIKSGPQIDGLPKNEKQHFFNIIDKVEKRKKKGMMDMVFGGDDSTKTKCSITLEKLSKIIREISNVPDNDAINIVVNTLGGSALACELFVKCLLNHKGTVRVFIPMHAFSAGSMIALASDEIYMCKNSVMGPVDPQLMDFPINSIVDALKDNAEQKSFMTSFARSYTSKIQEDYTRTLKIVLRERFGDDLNDKIVNTFSQDHHHGYPISVKELREMGLTINEIDIKWRDTEKVSECDITIVNSSDKSSDDADASAASVAAASAASVAAASASASDGTTTTTTTTTDAS